MIRFDNLPPEVMQSMCTPMHEILPATSSSSSDRPSTGALYMGSVAAAIDRDLLDEKKISDLVQVLDVSWLTPHDPKGLRCYKIEIVDSTSTDLTPYLEPVCQHIDTVLKSGRNILVHCHQGVSRSAAVVIAYLISRCNMTYDTALTLCQRKRACVKPNAGFVKALQEWERTARKPPHMMRRFTA